MTALNPTFAKLGVRDEIVRALTENGIEHPFAIQELTLPLALAGDDLIGQARTGMGKTLAFGVPLLHRIVSDDEHGDSGSPAVRCPPRAGCRADSRAVHPGLRRPVRRRQIPESRQRREGADVRRSGSPAERRVDLRRPPVRAADRGAAGRCRRGGGHSRPAAGPGSAGSPAARRPVRAGARRGRRDAGPRVPARHRAHPAPDPRGPAGDAVLGDDARPDHHAGPHVHEPAHAHPGRGATLLGGARHHRAVRVPRARAGQGRAGHPAAAGPWTGRDDGLHPHQAHRAEGGRRPRRAGLQSRCGARRPRPGGPREGAQRLPGR